MSAHGAIELRDRIERSPYWLFAELAAFAQTFADAVPIERTRSTRGVSGSTSARSARVEFVPIDTIA